MQKFQFFLFIFLFFLSPSLFTSSTPSTKVSIGFDELLESNKFDSLLKNKRVALITNQTAVNGQLKTSVELLKKNTKKKGYTITAFFAPEHGINGRRYAAENVIDEKDDDGIPIFSLHGSKRRPTKQMLKNIDLLIFDIQDIGSRSYTYISTLFYAMEEAAKENISVIVTDRPNPLSGEVIDGPMLDDDISSFVGYVNVPYCHGMTVGELAQFFNKEYKVNCDLHVIPMKGWKRSMTFKDTGLHWIPTSPNIPEADSPFYYPTTGIIGEVNLTSIGIGYTLPFKIIGAPWIKAEEFARHLNAQNYPGVYFKPFYFRPFYGKYAKKDCEGVLIVIKDPLKYKPVSTQYLILGILKSLYTKKFEDKIKNIPQERWDMFAKVNGTKEVEHIIKNNKFIAWKLKSLHSEKREVFIEKRKQYLIKEYNN